MIKCISVYLNHSKLSRGHYMKVLIWSLLLHFSLSAYGLRAYYCQFYNQTFKLPPSVFCEMCCIAAAAPFQHDLRDRKHGLIQRPISAALSASPSTVHLPQFRRLLTRVNIYKCALNNICCGLGSAAWWSRGDEAHHELMGTYTVSGSIRSSAGFKCHKQLVPDVCRDATQMN